MVSRGAKAILDPSRTGSRLQRPPPFVRAAGVRPVLERPCRRPTSLVGMHASDSGDQRYINEWEGHDGEFLPFDQKLSAFYLLVHAESRMISDVVASAIGHGLATRFPELRIMPVENGSSWVRPLVDKFQRVYERSPNAFDEDPDGRVQALHLRAPVPRGRPGRPGRPDRRRQRGVRVRLPAPRGHVRPGDLRRPARRASTRPTRPRSWAATSPAS